jgi:hypothetical protein
MKLSEARWIISLLTLKQKQSIEQVEKHSLNPHLYTGKSIAHAKDKTVFAINS